MSGKLDRTNEIWVAGFKAGVTYLAREIFKDMDDAPSPEWNDEDDHLAQEEYNVWKG